MEQSTLDAKIDELERSYRVADETVKSFLAARPELVNFLLEARPHIELQFGNDVVVELRFPRYEDDQKDLLAMIQTDLEPDAATQRFNRFSDEWFGEASGRPESWPLYINVE